MPSIRDLIAEALGVVPVHQLLGLEVVAAGDEGPTVVEIPVAPNAMGATGRVHGGVIGLLCDVACAVEASSAASYDHATQALVTADLHVRYLGNARGDRIRAEATVVQAGRSIVVVEGRVTDGEGRLVAIADLSASIVSRT